MSKKQTISDIGRSVEALLEFDRQREQREAATGALVVMYSDIFHGFVSQGLTRDESVRLTKAVIEQFAQLNK